MNMTTAQGRMEAIEAIGPKIRRQRRRLGLTLDELSGRTSISKPYLSLIETGRVGNPPSDEKLRRLEQTLGFTSGELLTQAHLQRTPRDVRAVLRQLMSAEGSGFGVQGSGKGIDVAEAHGQATKGIDGTGTKGQRDEATKGTEGKATTASAPFVPSSLSPLVPSPTIPDDSAYLSGVLKEMSQRSNNPFGHLTANAVPVINRVSAGYPTGFSDLRYPPRMTDEYISCPDVTDRDAFAARVHGDNMLPKYRAGDIVIFSPALSARDGDDCFIRFRDGQTTFKRVFFENGENNLPVLRLQPRNERYRAQMIPSEQVAGLHKAVYRYQRLDEE
jgi:SOS-response transcriptional repressor LexA/transcriptional regulator with XRE-family HTH domain